MWITTTPAESRAVSQLKSLPDRAAAIVGATLVEARLDAVLKGLLADLKLKDSSMHQRMFGPFGPIGAFGAKINLAYMLGVYDQHYWKDLDTVREIRNAFAHDLEAADFGDQRVAALSRNLAAFEKHYAERGTNPGSPRELGVTPVLYEKGLADQLKNPRARYDLCVRLYALKLFSHPGAMKKRAKDHAKRA